MTHRKALQIILEGNTSVTLKKNKMARKTFFSFHYLPDSWRVAQVRNMGVIEGSPAASDNDWETVKKGGDAAIQKWIDEQLSGRTCAIVLIGENTAGRRWIDYEIAKAWNDKKGVLGIYIHNLKDSNGEKSNKGKNPFDNHTFTGSETKLSAVVKTYDPPHTDSSDVYNYIKKNLESWVEAAVKQRQV